MNLATVDCILQKTASNLSIDLLLAVFIICYKIIPKHPHMYLMDLQREDTLKRNFHMDSGHTFFRESIFLVLGSLNYKTDNI